MMRVFLNVQILCFTIITLLRNALPTYDKFCVALCNIIEWIKYETYADIY